MFLLSRNDFLLDLSLSLSHTHTHKELKEPTEMHGDAIIGYQILLKQKLFLVCEIPMHPQLRSCQ